LMMFAFFFEHIRVALVDGAPAAGVDDELE
jgi:hypothetical protein